MEDRFQTTFSSMRQNQSRKRINEIQIWTDPISLTKQIDTDI